ncbi:hypothetical protein VTL71DRAFT_3685 [Oculimacula yallundae]|uniref:Uncharacterized protein n=1 Tax=Oculimacula yallundae TaxID=86028 RepID=A0ABR4C3T4_9HELO
MKIPQESKPGLRVRYGTLPVASTLLYSALRPPSAIRRRPHLTSPHFNLLSLHLPFHPPLPLSQPPQSTTLTTSSTADLKCIEIVNHIREC